MRSPNSAAAALEQHQIPSDLEALRSAMGTAKQQQQRGVGGVLQRVLSDVPPKAALPAAASRGDAALAMGSSSAVQSELARLRFQVDHLREENALQAAELQAAQGVLSSPEQVVSSTPTVAHPPQLCPALRLPRPFNARRTLSPPHQ